MGCVGGCAPAVSVCTEPHHFTLSFKAVSGSCPYSFPQVLLLCAVLDHSFLSLSFLFYSLSLSLLAVYIFLLVPFLQFHSLVSFI